MPQLGRTRPCAACPWLRSSLAGYLGADDPVGFYRASVTQERTLASAMPCHEQIDYEDPEWQDTQYPDTDVCAGNMAYLANHMKRPRDTGLAEAVKAVGKLPGVFSWAHEFIGHHMPGASKEEVQEAAQRASRNYY